MLSLVMVLLISSIGASVVPASDGWDSEKNTTDSDTVRVLHPNNNGGAARRRPDISPEKMRTLPGNVLNRPAAHDVLGETLSHLGHDATSSDIAEIAGIDKWSAISEPLFDQRQIGQEVPTPLGPGRTYPHRLICRSDTYAPLGVVGKSYRIYQHTDALADAHNVTQTLNLDWEYVSVTHDGARMTACLVMPDEVTEFNGGQERLQQYLTITNSHDGKRAYRIQQHTIRLSCMNQFRGFMGALAAGFVAGRNILNGVTARHSNNLTNRVSLFSEMMAESSNLNRLYAVQGEAMIATPMDIGERVRFYAEVLALDQNPDRIEVGNPLGLATKGQNKISALLDLEMQEQNQVGDMDGSRWQALQTVLDYLDHEHLVVGDEVSEKRAYEAQFGTGSRMKTKAQRLALDGWAFEVSETESGLIAPVAIAEADLAAAIVV